MTEPQTPSHYKILMIEDNPLDAELASHRLLGGGLSFDAKVVDTRAAFERAFRDERFDLILADYSLPDFDGLSALKIVRAVDKRIPFVFVSGVLGEDVAVETLLAGATDYVLKQKLDRLVPAVKRALTEFAEYKSRQLAEINLKKGEEQFAQLTNRLPAMVWTAELDGRLNFTNSLWQDNVGAVDFVFDERVIHPQDLATCRKIWSDAQLNGQPFELDCRYRMANGEYRWQLVWAAPVEDDQHTLIGWVGTCTDIEQKRFRDIQSRTAEKLAMTGRMASVIAHEINNPLEAMMNLLFLLQGEIESAAARDHLAQLEHELMRISSITKLTLQWSKEETSVTLLSARSLIEEVLRLFTGKIRNKNVQVIVDVDDSVSFHGVGGEIRQVLANLISNAIDAVRSNGRIRCTAQCIQKDGDAFVEVCVEDNGTGIAPELIPHLFVPFHSTKGTVGNGLGLYISKEIVDRHHGHLVVESQPDKGTNMRMFLPASQQMVAERASS